MKNIKIFSGSANQPLAKNICKDLKKDLLDVQIKTFKDGEVYVRLLESVRKSEVYIIQPTGPYPAGVNNNIMELSIMIDAAKRSSGSEIVAVIPYFGYARQDRKAKSREPITAKLVANLLTSAGATRVITMDLHSNQIQGFFDIPVDNLTALSLFFQKIQDLKLKDFVILAPDVGSVKKSQKIAEALNVPLVIVEKRRPDHNKAVVANLIGDVKDKDVIIIDDMIDTGGTIIAAAETVPEFGAKDVYIFATHALLSGDAPKKLQECKAKKIFVTDTLSIPDEKKFDKLEVISVSNFLAEAIKRIYKGEGISSLFRLDI